MVFIVFTLNFCCGFFLYERICILWCLFIEIHCIWYFVYYGYRLVAEVVYILLWVVSGQLVVMCMRSLCLQMVLMLRYDNSMYVKPLFWRFSAYNLHKSGTVLNTEIGVYCNYRNVTLIIAAMWRYALHIASAGFYWCLATCQTYCTHMYFWVGNLFSGKALKKFSRCTVWKCKISSP